MRDEKVYAVVVRNTFISEKAKNSLRSDCFWKLRCRKSAGRCGAKYISKLKCTTRTRVGPLLEVEMLKKCTLLWREVHFEVKIYKAPYIRTTFGAFRFRFAWQAQGIAYFLKPEQKGEGFVTCPKMKAGMGHLKKFCKDAFSVAGVVQMICLWEMLRGVAFWNIRFVGLLRWFCVTGVRMTWH